MAVYAATEYEYYFTVCARHHGEPFRNEVLARIVIDFLLWTKEKYKWLLYCYCLMPDHLHFVCRLTEKEVSMINAGARGRHAEGVLDHLARFKSYTTNRWRRIRQRAAGDSLLRRHPIPRPLPRFGQEGRHVHAVKRLERAADLAKGVN